MTANRVERGAVGPAGEVGFRVIRNGVSIPVVKPASWGDGKLTADSIIEFGYPDRSLPENVNEWRKSNKARIHQAYRMIKARDHGVRKGVAVFQSALFLRVIKGDGTILPLGLASCRLVTTAGVNFLVDAFQGTVEPEILRFHGIGTGTNAEATGDTALQTELTTQYNPDNTRATGSLTEGASANIFRTVGTNTVDASVAITEHGILSQAATGGGTLWDRSVFSAVNLVSGDSLESTYDLTIAAGG